MPAGEQYDFQRALVRLATDAEVRRRFDADPAATLRGLEVSGRAADALLSIDPEALRRYAGSLVAKRWRSLQATVPLTARLYPGLADAHRAWAELHPNPGGADMRLSPGAVEGLRALSELRRACADDDLAPAYGPDLLTFEIQGAATRRDQVRRTFRARYEIHTIASELRRGIVPIDPPLAATWIRFERGMVRWKAA